MERVGTVLNFTKETLSIYEERCRPDHGRKKNNNLIPMYGYGFCGKDLYSDTGFISDTDSLYDVCKADDDYVKETLGENGHNMISGSLLKITTNEMFRRKYPELFEGINIDTSKYNVDVKQYMGVQYCPFVDVNTLRCGYDIVPQYTTVDFTIAKIETGDTLTISGLNLHLIHHHHFYQGNVSHRISPQRLIEFFNIVRS